jgi:hypothetical protein
MIRTAVLVVSVLAFFIGCSESQDSSASPGGSAGSGAGASGSSGAGGGGGAAAGGTSGAAGSSGSAGSAGAPGAVVINEISGHADWFEIYNGGSAPLDLSGFGATDTSSTDGKADVAGAVRLPAGTSLAAGGFLLVAGKGTPPALCGAPPSCFSGTFGISASKGESVYLISNKDVVVAEGSYPMNATPDDKTTWSRLPDGTGAFAPGAPTPGGKNKAP